VTGCCEHGNELPSFINCEGGSSRLREILLASHDVISFCVGLVMYFFKWANLSAITHFSRMRY
jgi:hypothetical protein